MAEVLTDSQALQESWRSLLMTEITALNQALRAAGFAPIEVPK
jgi:hypothetical protein